MKRRQRVMDALNFKETDRVPMDLGGMLSTSVSCFVYSSLRKELGLPEGYPMIYDEYQMLAIPEADVLDALDCDVVFVDRNYSNAFNVKNKFEYYDFNGRLPALVNDKSKYKVLDDGTIINGKAKMPPTSSVFESEHAGQIFDINNLHKRSLIEMEKELKSKVITNRKAEEIALLCRNARESTDRAIFLNSYELFLDFVVLGGIANGSMLCLLEPDYVKEAHGLITEYTVKTLEKLMPYVKENVDIVLTGNCDMGTQNSTMVAPDILNELLIKYFKYANDTVHKIAPNVKTFLHSCGAIYSIMDYIIDANFDILNPVQWSAGEQSYMDWKDKARNKITLWGGGVDSQHVLPFGKISDVEKQVEQVVTYMKQDGGYVFNNIHNITADIDPKKIIAMYKIAKHV